MLRLSSALAIVRLNEVNALNEMDLYELDNRVIVHDLTRSYRVEHRLDCGCVSVLARIHNVFPHHDTLLPYVSYLRLKAMNQDLGGQLVLVDDLTNVIYARRDLSRITKPAKGAKR